MKEKILKLQNGIEYCVLEDLTYENRTFLLCAECDLEKNDLKTDELYVMEKITEDNEEYIIEIQDENLAQKVVCLFEKKYKNNL